MLKQIATRLSSDRELSIGRVLSVVGLVGCIAIGILVGGYAGSRVDIPWTASLLLFIAAVVAGMYGAQAFFELDGWLEQRRRDLVADRIWAALKNGRPPPHPFTLYLRPFASTDHIGANVDKFVRMRPVAGGPTMLAMGSDRLEFESVVEQALRPIGPLVALGKPLEHRGAGRIEVSDGDWQDAILRLMAAARLIVLLPSSRPGTTWEVRTLLAAGRLAKTIVVDPPDHLGRSDRDYDPSAEWHEVRRAFASEGFVMPQDDPEGLLLYFGNRATPVRSAKITLDGAGSVKAFANQVLNDIETSSGPR